MDASKREAAGIRGTVVIELFGEDGTLKHREEHANLITQKGDQLYAERGAGIGSPPATPTGMKLGTGSTAVAKTGAGAALVTYLSDSHQAFDATFPSSALNGSSRRITYKATWAAGKATTASAITEAVIVLDTLANAASTEANTCARVLISGVSAKSATDVLAITWYHDLLGA